MSDVVWHTLLSAWDSRPRMLLRGSSHCHTAARLVTFAAFPLTCTLAWPALPPHSGQLDHAFTAHPKIDPATGEMFYFGYSTEQAPYCEPAGERMGSMWELPSELHQRQRELGGC